MERISNKDIRTVKGQIGHEEGPKGRNRKQILRWKREGEMRSNLGFSQEGTFCPASSQAFCIGYIGIGQCDTNVYRYVNSH